MSEIWQRFIVSLQLPQQPSPLFSDAIYPLDAHRFLDINGQDAAKFLQGQLSCDVQQVSLIQSSLGSHSNAKGRMQSSFRICRYSDNGFLLRVHHSIQEQAKAALAKYIVFSKASMSINNNQVGIGLHGKKAYNALSRHFSAIPNRDYEQIVTNDCILICTSAEKSSYEIYAHQDQCIDLWRALSTDLTPCNCEQHHLLENHLGLAFLEIGTYDAFIPQMFNYQMTPAISFKKGCYTGQEIVARMHYLGKIKRHMRHFTTQHFGDIAAGDAVFTQEKEQSIGDVVSAVKTALDEWDLLINITDINAGTSLKIAANTLSNINEVPLPYSLTE